MDGFQKMMDDANKAQTAANPQQAIINCRNAAKCLQLTKSGDASVRKLDLDTAKSNIDAMTPLMCPALGALLQSYRTAAAFLQKYQDTLRSSMASCDFEYGIDISTELISTYPGGAWAKDAEDARTKLLGWKQVKDAVQSDLSAARSVQTKQEADKLLAHARSIATLPCLQAMVAAAEGAIQARFKKQDSNQGTDGGDGTNSRGRGGDNKRKTDPSSVIDSVTESTGVKGGGTPRPPDQPGTTYNDPGTRDDPNPPMPRNVPGPPKMCTLTVTSDIREGFQGDIGKFTITVGGVPDEITEVTIAGRVSAQKVGNDKYEHNFRFQGIPGPVNTVFVAWDKDHKERCQQGITVYSKGVRK